jgi:hypothetical protein
VLGAIVVLAGLYAAFVAHYSLNVPFEDDWTLVPLIHAALHGHLSVGALWALHDENRMFVPNLIFVFSGVVTHDDLRVLIALSVVFFIASFLIYLALFRTYTRRPLTPLAVLVLGLIWFSVEDWNNALWAFQLAWYLILLCLMVMIALLTTRSQSTIAFVVAILAAVVASFSFVHGLTLWPVGLICLIWTAPRRLRQWSRRRRIQVLVWIGSAVCTTTAALWGYTFQGLGCNTGGGFQFSCSGSVSHYALQHPWRLVEFVLINIGEVVHNDHLNTLWLNGLLGAVLLAAAAFVTVQSIRHRADGRSCLPVALICFGLVFDVLVALGRLQFLDIAAPSSIYTMANLVIVMGLISYFWVHVPVPSDRNALVRKRVLVTLGLAVLVMQVGIASQAGLSHARTWDTRLLIGARLAVNLDRIPASQTACYQFYGELGYLIFAPQVVKFVGFAEARQDKLTVFTPALYRKYRAEGLPVIPPCKA